MPDKIPMNHGKDLVAAILDHPQGGAEALLEFTGGQETECLELKAALYPQDGAFMKGETLDDLRWHVAEAVFAMANSYGGAVIIGVDDQTRSVGLEASDPKGTLAKEVRDAFDRKVVLSTVVKKQWKMKNVSRKAQVYARRNVVRDMEWAVLIK